MPQFTQGGKRRSERLWDGHSNSLMSHLPEISSERTSLPPMTTNNQQTEGPPPPEEEYIPEDTIPPTMDPYTEEQINNNDAYWDNHYEYDVTEGWVNPPADQQSDQATQYSDALFQPPTLKPEQEVSFHHNFTPTPPANHEIPPMQYDNQRERQYDSHSQPSAEE